MAGDACAPVEGEAGVAGVADVVPDGVVWADGMVWPDGVVAPVAGVEVDPVVWAKAAPASERVAAAANMAILVFINSAPS